MNNDMNLQKESYKKNKIINLLSFHFSCIVKFDCPKSNDVHIGFNAGEENVCPALLPLGFGLLAP